MKITHILIFLCALCIWPAAHAAKRALVMGNATYLKDGKPSAELSLPRSQADAQAVADTLRQLGFVVHGQGPLLNGRNQSMTEAIERFTQSVQPGDEVVFYFSGHGLSTDGGNFLVPVDAPPLDLDASDYSLVKNYQSVDLTLKALQARKPKLVVAILDACRSYPTRQINAKLGNQTTAGLNTRYEHDNGQLVMYAASHGRTALSWIDAKDNNPYSVYTRVLIEEMQRPAPSISAMADRVQWRVHELTAHRTHQQGGPQRPEYVNKLYAPFSFVPMAAQAAAPSPPVDTAKDAEIARLREQLAQAQRPVVTAVPRDVATAGPSEPVAKVSVRNAAPMIDGYEILDDPVLGQASLARDPKTGLVWQRCSVGQSWSASTCTGEAKQFTFHGAQKLAGNGWRVPTLRELHSLVWCSSGQTKDRDDPQDGGPVIANYCQGQYQSPTIRSGAFPATSSTWYWTSSPYVGVSDFAWGVLFNGGSVNGDLRGNGSQVRLVRASQ
jgi:hypothetical protein